MKVSLTREQSEYACSVGVARRLGALAKGRRDAKGYRSSAPSAAPFEIDIQGAAAEYAAGLALGVEWKASTKPDKIAGDLQLESGPLDVRSTKYEAGSLLIHDRDISDRRFLLVTGQVPDFELRGWIWGHEGVRPELLRTYKGRTSYWIPQADLRPLEALT